MRLARDDRLFSWVYVCRFEHTRRDFLESFGCFEWRGAEAVAPVSALDDSALYTKRFIIIVAIVVHYHFCLF